MKRFSLALLTALVTALGAYPAAAQTPRRRSRSTCPRSAGAARRHLSRRDRRRRHQLQGRHFRLYPDRSSDRLARRLAHVRASAARACSSSIPPEISCARSARTVYGFMYAQQVRIDPQDNIWVVDPDDDM